MTPVTLGVNNPLGEADPGATGAGANGPGGDASDNLTADFGFVTDFAVGNYVWVDANGNGIQDPGESPVPGSVVTLFDADATTPALDFQGNPVAPVTTDVDGHYVFDNLIAGSYRVAFSSPPAGYVFGSNPLSVTLGVADPQLRPIAPSDGPLNATAIDPTIDAGLEPVFAVGDFVWIDSNHNGIQDVGEPGVPDVTVTLKTSAGQPVATTTTDNVGHYSFDDLLAGSYQVAFSTLPTGYTFTSQFAPGGTSANNSNADSTGLSDLFALSLDGPDMRAVAPGDGVTHALQIDPTVDAGLVPVPSFAVGDDVWIDGNGNGVHDAGEAPVAGATVTLLAADGVAPAIDIFGDPVAPMVTNAAGYYAFDDLPAGSYVAHFSDPLGGGYRFTGKADSAGTTAVFTIGDGQPDTSAVTAADTATNGGSLDATKIDRTINAGLEPVLAVGGEAFADNNGDGVNDGDDTSLAGLPVTLENSAATVVATTVTGATGHYVFDGLLPGGYLVVFGPAPPGYRFDPAGSTTALTLDLSDPNLTAPDGTLDAAAIDPTIDAGVIPVLAIGGRAWADGSGNGIQDDGEPAEPGLTVALLTGAGQPALDIDGNPAAVTTTDFAGHYVFDNLAPGSYEVAFSGLPAFHAFTTAAASGSTDADNSDAGVDGRTASFTLNGGSSNGGDPDVRATVATDGTTAAAEIDPTIDAGVVPLLALGGNAIFLDTNSNGVQDPGEPAVAGIVAALFTVNAVTTSATTTNTTPADNAQGAPVAPITSGGDGVVIFDDLAPGNYTVQFTHLPAGFEVPGDTTGDGFSPVVNLTASDSHLTSVPPDSDLDALMVDSTSVSVALTPFSTSSLVFTGNDSQFQLELALVALVLGCALLLMAGHRRV